MFMIRCCLDFFLCVGGGGEGGHGSSLYYTPKYVLMSIYGRLQSDVLAGRAGLVVN